MNYYEVLGISKDASKDQIKQAYRKLALQNHPDKHVHSPKSVQDAATLKFKKANEAYETLIDDRMRASYDNIHRSSYQSHYDSSSNRSNHNYGSNGYKSDSSGRANQSSQQKYGSDSYKSDYSGRANQSSQQKYGSDSYKSEHYNSGGSKSKKSEGFGFEFTPGMGIRGFRLRTGYGLMWDLVGTVACIWVMETIGGEKLLEILKEFEEKLDTKLKESKEKI